MDPPPNSQALQACSSLHLCRESTGGVRSMPLNVFSKAISGAFETSSVPFPPLSLRHAQILIEILSQRALPFLMIVLVTCPHRRCAEAQVSPHVQVHNLPSAPLLNVNFTLRIRLELRPQTCTHEPPPYNGCTTRPRECSAISLRGTNRGEHVGVNE